MSAFLFITENAVDHIEQVEVACLTLSQLADAPPDQVEMFVLNGTADPDYLEQAVRIIRQQTNPAVYLRPIIVVNCPKHMPGHLARICDHTVPAGNFGGFGLQQVRDAIGLINRRIAELPEYQHKTDTQLSLKILRFLYTRQRELLPYRSSRTMHGLHYPELEVFLDHTDQSIFNLLAFLEEQRLLSGRFFEKVYLCNQCQSSHLNFVENCPDCRSSDLRQESLIHHFPCAHVAPEQEFRQSAQLICPKCEHTLRGLGLDYDKPSTVYQCQQCQHTTQDPEVNTTCFHCGAQSAPEDLIVRVVKEYRLSALAANAAKYGLDNLLQRILEKEITMLPLHAFKIIVGIENERIKRYKVSKSSLTAFQLGGLDTLYLQLGERNKDIFSEMGAIVKSVLRNSDITTGINESTFLSLLPETEKDGAERAMERLREKFVALFESSLRTKITVTTSTLAITGDMEADGMVSAVLNDATLR